MRLALRAAVGLTIFAPMRSFLPSAAPVPRFEVEVHARRHRHRTAGSGPVVVLLHGVAASSTT